MAILLLYHHTRIHPEYEYPDRLFQVSDVSNHETWVVALLAFGAGVHYMS
jgi:hypothetical protein